MNSHERLNYWRHVRISGSSFLKEWFLTGSMECKSCDFKSHNESALNTGVFFWRNIPFSHLLPANKKSRKKLETQHKTKFYKIAKQSWYCMTRLLSNATAFLLRPEWRKIKQKTFASERVILQRTLSLDLHIKFYFSEGKLKLSLEQESVCNRRRLTRTTKSIFF